eukprot:NODE_20318_length_803_cov_7.374260.p1 GENE.NODE_20318_length_803_cov_7.374260~~NODE_20318_length_803_cov_7.374260.p1  ORF type:complete len:226 (+),score=60.23 NODE_20318_length_803_cov_7.374260:42-680(+)
MPGVGVPVPDCSLRTDDCASSSSDVGHCSPGDTVPAAGAVSTEATCGAERCEDPEAHGVAALGVHLASLNAPDAGLAGAGGDSVVSDNAALMFDGEQCGASSSSSAYCEGSGSAAAFAGRGDSGAGAGDGEPDLRAWFFQRMDEVSATVDKDVLWGALTMIEETSLGDEDAVKMWLGLPPQEELPRAVALIASEYGQRRAMMRYSSGTSRPS